MDTEEVAEGVTKQHLNRRQVLRFAVDEAGAMTLVSHGTRYTCRILDLSLGGCRLSTDEKLMLGDSVRVELTFRVNGILFRFPGVTRWTEGRTNFGIEFSAMSSRRKAELAEIIAEIAEEAAASAARLAAAEEAARDREVAEAAEAELRLRQAMQRLVEQESQRKQAEHPEDPEQAEQETRRKLAERVNQRRQAEREALQLAAQFRSAAAAPLVPERIRPEQSVPAPPLEKLAPRERRVASRHEVDTSAVIHLINISSKQSGRIIDLSLGGCRIETDERFPVGIYTRVETEFHLEGLPFRLGGVVQALHKGRIVGLRFLDMSSRKREQLEQLIAEIEESRASR
jgi:c-di-GMP-binding flagellar brake protein YcgR